MVDKKYLEEAKQMLMGGYENQKVQLNNSFNQNVQGLEGQKAGVNQNFDNQLQQNAMNTTRSQNQYNNNTLARGLGRSTIATSGQAGIQDQGNRIANQVNDQRTQALGNIESQKTLLQQALQENLLGLQSKQESESLSLAQQLEALQYERDWQNQQFTYQQSQDKWNQDFKMQQFEYQKQQDALARQLALAKARGADSSSNSKKALTGETWDSLLKDYTESGDAYIVEALGKIKDSDPTTYKEYMQLYRAAQYQRANQLAKKGIGTTSHITNGGITYRDR
jgi:hypothetical protein